MDILTILGFIFTIVFGLIGLKEHFHKKKYPKRIQFYLLDKVNILNSVAKKIESIKIFHNQTQIHEPITYVKGLFYCNGDNDVILKSENINNECFVQLPEGYEWLEVHKQEHDNNIQVNFKINEKDKRLLNIEGDIIKREEIFCFDGFFIKGSNTTDDKTSKLTVKHRLFDTEIKESGKIDINIAKRKNKLSVFAFTLSTISFLLLIFMRFTISAGTPLRYSDRIDKNSNIYIAQMLQKDSVIVVNYEDLFFSPRDKRLISTKVFDTKYKPSDFFDSKRLRFLDVLLVSLGILYLFTLIIFVRSLYIEYSMKKIIKKFERLNQTNKEC